jgi:NADH-quinone oxidoreductase subunit B
VPKAGLWYSRARRSLPCNKTHTDGGWLSGSTFPWILGAASRPKIYWDTPWRVRVYAGTVHGLDVPRSAGPLEPVRYELAFGRRYSLWVFNLGLACCAVEFVAASVRERDLERLGVKPVAHEPRRAEVLVVAGTVTDKMAPVVLRTYEQLPEPRYVISYGACADSGGPYWDSYCVTKGADQLIPVDVYVPGCPPRPEALLHGFARLHEKIAAPSGAPVRAGDGRTGASADGGGARGETP